MMPDILPKFTQYRDFDALSAKKLRDKL